MPDSALVIVVVEAEPVVGRYRLQHDPVAALGVPAHVTILFPFSSELDPEREDQIRSLAASIEPFEMTFRAIGRFPGGVLHLVPEPIDRVRAVIRQAMDAFPDHPPYGGEITDPTPHLTIGMALDDDTADRISAEIAPRLPIRTRVDELTLLVTDDEGRWVSARGWPLGPRFRSSSAPR